VRAALSIRLALQQGSHGSDSFRCSGVLKENLIRPSLSRKLHLGSLFAVSFDSAVFAVFLAASGYAQTNDFCSLATTLLKAGADAGESKKLNQPKGKTGK